MNIRFNALAGHQTEFPLEHRILSIMLVFGAMLCFVGAIVNLIFDLGAVLTTITFFGAVLFAYLYYLSTVKKQYTLPMFSGLITVIIAFTPAVWLLNGGISGSVPYYLIIFSSAIAIVLSGFTRFVFISCLTAVISALIILEYRYPFLIKGYSSDMERFIDIAVAIILAIISNAVLFATVVNRYNKENKRVRDYLAQLEMVNRELQREMNERMRAEEAVRASEDKYRTIFQTAGTAVIIIEHDTTISLANEEFEKLSGYSKSEIEEKISWKQFVLPEDVGRMVKYYFNHRNGAAGSLKNYEIRFFDRQGKAKHAIASVSLIPGTKKRVVSLVDITNMKEAEARLKYLATHDYLTGIPNRYSFEESLKQILTKAKHEKESALLFIDIDNFKLINDTNGHTAGDDFLINIASTIKDNLREGDILARLGGDEFGVLLENTTVEEARLLAEKLRQITESNEFCFPKYGCLNSSFSIGVVMIDGTLDSQRLLSLADTALYAAKEKGRNRVVLLERDVEITTELTEINQLYGLIKNAVKEGRFVLHFQPVVQVDNGDIVHYEALIRLKQEDGKIILPQTFIHVAERFGLMPQIDRWVVETSLDALRHQPSLSVFVNISGISLSDGSLLETIEEMVTQSDVEPCRIGFEITETAAVKDILLARHWIERLNKLGCRFALDDFGIGFSSFSYLRALPVDYLKIDGSFIRNLDTNSSNRALVEAINTISHSLNKKTVAEYVENSNVLNILRELKIDYAQGYFLGMPAPISGSASQLRECM